MPRQESPIHPQASPELKRLATAMREVKAAATDAEGNSIDLSYKELAELAHYSTASLSLAASGKRMPSWEVTWAYVCGCDRNAKESDWRPLWEAARDAEEQRSAESSPTAEPDNAQRRPRRRASVADLVRDEVARQQQTLPFRASDVDAVRTALALCTNAEDFRALLNELKGTRKPDELKESARRKGRVLRKSDIHAMLDGDGIPETEPLHAFLVACEVAQGQVHEWHHTATRLKISQARVDEPPQEEPFRLRRFMRRRRSQLNLSTMVAVATLIVTTLQIVTMLKYI
ncbi:hypothetical protein ABZ864_40890 [Streptomyces sp. NPDC047082]|uniref:hypothetical protein n=1 Tax=Streptomyces sp. NPDC047082 TaxID=3155259 RepID=UPI0033DEE6F5